MKLSALKRTRWLYNIVVFFFECIVWMTGSLRPTTSLYVNEFNTFFGITLITNVEEKKYLSQRLSKPQKKLAINKP